MSPESSWRLTSRGEAQARSGGMSDRELVRAITACQAEVEFQGYDHLACLLANDLRGAAAADKRQRYYADLAETWRTLLAQRGEG